MAQEIERKFVVRSLPKGVLFGTSKQWDKVVWIEQAYILTLNPVVRVGVKIDLERIRENSPLWNGSKPARALSTWKTFFTVKVRDESNDWRTQQEYEQQIPLRDAWNLLDLATIMHGSVTKIRFFIGRLQLDIFTKPSINGLALLEIELARADEKIHLPDGWDILEVTEDPRSRFSNAHLASVSSLTELGIAGGGMPWQ